MYSAFYSDIGSSFQSENYDTLGLREMCLMCFSVRGSRLPNKLRPWCVITFKWLKLFIIVLHASTLICNDAWTAYIMCPSLLLKPNLFAFQCCSQIANSPKAQAQKKKENTKIGQWAAQCISDKWVTAGVFSRWIRSLRSGYDYANMRGC